jgi:hypothetical protein
MTPKEKAEYLVKIIIGKYYDWNSEYAENKSFQVVREQIRGNEWFIVKDLALFLVDECIKHEKQIVEQIKSLQLPNSFIAIINEGSFWQQVKHEIINL